MTPGITALEYANRRSQLANRLPQNGVAVIAASELKYKSGAVFYEFHQNSDFFYLTGKTVVLMHNGHAHTLLGFNEPEALAIIGTSHGKQSKSQDTEFNAEKTGPGDAHAFHLYCRPKDPRAELWEGARSGIQAAQDVFNADKVRYDSGETLRDEH